MKKNEGLGTSVPPLKEHVLIYFLQKNSSEAEAIFFYDQFQKRKWKNKRNRKVANWKTAAWCFLLNRQLFNLA